MARRARVRLEQEHSAPSLLREMTGGHDRLIRLALAHVGQLP